MGINSKRKGVISDKKIGRKLSASVAKHEDFAQKNSHQNFMAGRSYSIGNPIFNLRLAASSSFFGEPQYYKADKGTAKAYSGPCSYYSNHRDYLNDMLHGVLPKEWQSLGPTAAMELAIDAALDYSVEETLQEAVRLRNEDNIRTTPQVILVRAARHKNGRGTGLITKYAPYIIKRADEPAVGLAYQLKLGGPIPNSLKKAWKSALEGFNEYQLAKYRMNEREVKTVDVVNLVHPKGDAFGKLVKGELKNELTWEAMRSAGKSWEECIPNMGHMALLRNLRNFVENKVDTKLYLPQLKAGVQNGKQLPFRYFTAYKNLAGAPPSVLDAVEDCLMMSVENVPTFAGKTMSLCDNSGSAHGAFTSEFGSVNVANIANLTGVIAGMASEEGYVGVFGDRLEVFGVRKHSSVFEQAEKANSLGRKIGQGTEHGIWLFWDNAIKKKEHWDNVFIFSDMQAGHGGLYGTGGYSQYIFPDTRNSIDVPKLIMEYRAKVNKNVMVYLVQVAGYQDTIVPEFYDKTFVLGGWSGNLLNFAHEMSKLCV